MKLSEVLMMSSMEFMVRVNCVISINNEKGDSRIWVNKDAVKTYKLNLDRQEIIQRKTRKLVNKKMSEKLASDRIQKWICKHCRYQAGDYNGMDTGDAWTAYKAGIAKCDGYAKKRFKVTR